LRLRYTFLVSVDCVAVILRINARSRKISLYLGNFCGYKSCRDIDTNETNTNTNYTLASRHLRTGSIDIEDVILLASSAAFSKLLYIGKVRNGKYMAI